MARKKITKKVSKAAKSAAGRRGKATGSRAAKARRGAGAKSKAGARRARRSRDAIMAILEEARSRGSNAEVIRKHDLSPTTFYSWKRKYAAGRRKRSK